MTHISVLEGVDGIKKAYERTLTEDNLSIVCLSDNYDKILDGYFTDVYSPRLYSPQRKIREILPKKFTSETKHVQSNNHEVRYINPNEGCESDMILSKNVVVLISFTPTRPFAVVIGDAELVKCLNLQFETMWNTV